MAYFEASRLKDSDGNIINPAQEESLTLLRSIFRLLKPLGMLTGGQSNRLSVDINNITTGSITASGTVTANCNINANQTLANVSNVSNTGGVNTFDLMKAMSRTAYNSGIRSNIN